MRLKMVLNISNAKIHLFDFDPTSNFLFCSSRSELFIIDTSTFSILGVIQIEKRLIITSFCFFPVNKKIVIMAQSLIFIYSLSNGEREYTLNSPGGDMCTCAAFSEDGKLFAASYNDGYFLLFNAENYDNSENKERLVLIHDHKYEYAIIMFSFSAGGNLIALGFENGYIIIKGTRSDHKWIMKAHSPTSSVCVTFNATNSLKFFTVNQKKGEVKYFTINKKNEIECYKSFKSPNSLRLPCLAFSCDKTIIFGCSSKKLFAWRIDTTELINSISFELEVDSFQILLAHYFIPEVVLIIAHSSIWLWNCLSNECNMVFIINEGEPLFQTGNWLKYNSAIIQTNAGTFNIFGTEDKEWKQPEISNIEYDGKWSPKLNDFFQEYIIPQNVITMSIFERRILKFYQPIDNVDSDFSSSSE